MGETPDLAMDQEAADQQVEPVDPVSALEAPEVVEDNMESVSQ